jgi:hypothetical protein
VTKLGFDDDTQIPGTEEAEKQQVEPESHCNNLDDRNHRESLTVVVKGVLFI